MAAGSEGAPVWAQAIDLVQRTAGIARPVSAFALAIACGLEPTPQIGRSDGLVGDQIRLDARSPDEWQDAFVLRCVARWALRSCGATEHDEAIRHVVRLLIGSLCSKAS